MTQPRRLTLAELPGRVFETLSAGSCYRLRVPGALIELEVDRLYWSKAELLGELIVRCDLAGTEAIDGVLSRATFNLSSARARTERATLLERQARSPEIPWNQLVEELCQRTLTAERSGDPAVPLRDIPRSDPTFRTVRVFGFNLPIQHSSIIFGDGGASKSLLSLYLGGLLAKAGHRVLLADWELTGEDHRERFEQLFGEAMPSQVLYARCYKPLIHEADRLERIVRMQGIDVGIFDSVGFATHEAPETAAAALGYFQAVRRIGVGGIHIAHINRSEAGDQKPFGSQFWHNSARATWFLKATEDQSGLTVGVFNRKMNLGPRQQPFAYSVAFDGGSTAFNLTEITENADLAGSLSLSQRIRELLRAGARSREDVAAAFPDAKPDTIRRTIERGLKSGQYVEFPGPNGDRLGLKARGAA